MHKSVYARWYKLYKKVKWLHSLIEAESQIHKEFGYHSDKELIKQHQLRIEECLDEQRYILDCNNCKMPSPTWQYKRYDHKTHASSPEFIHYDKI